VDAVAREGPVGPAELARMPYLEACLKVRAGPGRGSERGVDFMHTMRLQLSPLHSASHQVTANLAGQRTLCSCQRALREKSYF